MSNMMMEEEIPLFPEANLDIKPKIEVNETVIENLLESPPCNSVCPETSTPEGEDKKINNSNEIESKDDEIMDDGNSDLGGRLTFFREGKPLLELSHRTEQGSWVQVKSKTYWPPSTVAKTTTQLKNGSSLWSADECSNNSSAFTDHLRKQTSPKRLMSQSGDFYWHSITSSDCYKSKHRRDPFILIYFNSCDKHQNRKRIRTTLKAKLRCICEKLGLNTESSLTIHALYEKWKSTENDSVQSPRKRLMKYINGEKDGHSRKKPYSGFLPISHKNCDKAAGSSLQFTNKSTSSYSIESLLNNDCSRSESFLRNLLKSNPKDGQSSLRNYSGHDHQRNLRPKNFSELNNSTDRRNSKHPSPDYNSLRKVAPAIGNFYLPYMNPGYMVMPPFYSANQPSTEMASMVAAAINLQGMQNSSILPSASLEASYRGVNLHSPQPRAPGRSSHSPQPRSLNRASPNSPQSRTPNRASNSPQPRPINHSSPNSPQPRAGLASPHSISPSPNSKHPFNSHMANMSSYIHLLNSPPSPWVPSTSNSPPNQSSLAVSPPPQDVPLNLSKRKEKG